MAKAWHSTVWVEWATTGTWWPVRWWTACTGKNGTTMTMWRPISSDPYISKTSCWACQDCDRCAWVQARAKSTRNSKAPSPTVMQHIRHQPNPRNHLEFIRPIGPVWTTRRKGSLLPLSVLESTEISRILVSRFFYQSPDVVGGPNIDGTMATYNGGGYVKNLAHTKDESTQILEYLKSNLWLDRGTRAVFLDFTVYNANINLFCQIRYRAWSRFEIVSFSFANICIYSKADRWISANRRRYAVINISYGKAHTLRVIDGLFCLGLWDNLHRVHFVLHCGRGAWGLTDVYAFANTAHIVYPWLFVLFVYPTHR